MARRVLFVHGAWHGAWCWERVLVPLAAAGVEVRAIDLPGHGADGGPLGDLHDDAERVRRELDRLGHAVVLVGHSYGGVVITEAGDHDAVDHLVYVASFPLDTHESTMSLVLSAGVDPTDDGSPTLADGFAAGPGESVVLDPTVAAACLYSDCDEPTTSWALSRLGPQANVTFVQEPAVAAWRLRPSTYALCLEDKAVPAKIQRLLAGRCGAQVEWPTGHSPFLSRPDLVVGLVAELAGGSRAGAG